LIEKYGRLGNMMTKRDAHQLHDRCDLICPTCRRRFESPTAQGSSTRIPATADPYFRHVA
jgi:hypothetical protein